MSGHISDLVKQREEAMDRAGRALDKAWPERKSDEYIREMDAASKDLERIAAAMQAMRVQPVEQSRTYRYLGSVYSDLAPALGKELFVKSRDAYLKAQALLGSHGDALEQAKLDFNFGNMLRHFDRDDVKQLSEAERRLLAARKIFAQQAPQNLAGVDQALASVRTLLKLAPLKETVERNRADLDTLAGQMKSGGSPAEMAAEMREIRERGGGVTGLFAALQGVVNELPDSARQGDAYARLQEQMRELTSLALGGVAVDPKAGEIAAQLRQKLQDEISAGRVTRARAKTLAELLDGIDKIMGSGGDDLQSLMAQVQGMRERASAQFANLHYLSHGIERPPKESRAAQLVELWWAVRLFLLEESFQPGKGDKEGKTLLDLNIRASQVDKRIYEAGSDNAQALVVEQEAMRPLGLEVRNFAARHHPLLVKPIWPVARVQVETNALLFAGSSKLGRQVAGVCKKLGLDLLSMPKGDDIASARWRQLQTASVCVFDLGVEEGPDRAAVAYELGIARTLGKPIVVLAREDQRVPFDVDVEPVLVSGSAQDADGIAEAIDRALVWTMPRPRSGVVLKTIEDVLSRHSVPRSDIYLEQTLKQLRLLQTDPDPIALTVTLKTLTGFLGADAPMLIHPVWPPAYPEPEMLRLFHVMPFRPEWADTVAERVEKVCRSMDVRYVRGDRVQDPNVIRSIWEEINRATHVLVDLTGFNANVALELGIAHTLGRPTLMVGQGSTVKELFSMIAKLRFDSYERAVDSKLDVMVKSLLSERQAEA